MTPTVAGIILAGGLSSRMGRDKALLTVAGETLIHRTCRVALACTDGVYVVTGRGDRYRPLVSREVRWIVEHPAIPSGPLMGLVHALSVMATEAVPAPTWVLVLACDLPNLAATPLQTWRAQLDQVEPHCLAYLPYCQGRWEPLCGFYRTTALADLQQYAAAGGRSLQKWLQQRSVAAIPGVDEHLLVNVNCPADWTAWQRTIFPNSP
jgi:molybdenum cofactor guanylyltransferase